VPVALENNPFFQKSKGNPKNNPFIERARQADAEVERLQAEFDIRLPDTPEAMLELLQTLDDDELQELLKSSDELEQRLREFGPQDDDELHAWIKAELGINLPRTSVCPGHDAPFKFIADLYFERVGAVLAMGNRGGGKTLLVAILHWLNSLFKPGVESCTFGATEAQSLRCYAYIKGWIYVDGQKRPEVISSLMRETLFANASRLEVLPGTPDAVNGPHPQKAHADEVELMREDTWKESRNMTMGKNLPNGTFIRPQDICTSTRKGPNGRMQKLIDEITAAVNAGYEPPRTLYQWCIKETAQKMPNCRVANPNLPEDQKCRCNKIRKGDWEDGSPRLLEHICNGDFYRADGWQPFENIIKQFTENDQETFETQSLCLKPEMRFHYLPKFNEAKHCFRNYEPDPRNGPIYTSVDWGGTNPHAVNWYQYLKFDIEVDCFVQSVQGRMLKMRIPAGSIICFDEIYKAEIGNQRLGQLVKLKESNYRRQWGPSWMVTERFADPQGKSARTDWKDIGLKTSWHITREFEEHIKVITDIFDDNAFYVAGDKCPMWVREAHEWRRHETTGLQIDTFNHCMSNFRYAVANIAKLHRRNTNKASSAPVVVPAERQAMPGVSIRRDNAESGPLGISSSREDEFSIWRGSLGQPVRAGATFR
jgi:hypothetical protein